MKINLRIISSFSIIIGIILLVRILILFPSVLMTTDTPGIYSILTITCLIFSGMTFFFLFKFITYKERETLTKTVLIAGIVQFISMVLLLLSTVKGLEVLTIVSYYLGDFLLLVGGISYLKSPNKYIDISFMAWGIFVILWINSFYYGIFTVAV